MSGLNLGSTCLPYSNRNDVVASVLFGGALSLFLADLISLAFGLVRNLACSVTYVSINSLSGSETGEDLRTLSGMFCAVAVREVQMATKKVAENKARALRAMRFRVDPFGQLAGRERRADGDGHKWAGKLDGQPPVGQPPPPGGLGFPPPPPSIPAAAPKTLALSSVSMSSAVAYLPALVDAATLANASFKALSIGLI